MAERVVDLLEMIQVDEKERQSTLWCSRSNAIGVVGEEGSEHELELATVRETRQLVSHSLTPALLGKSAHPSHRQRQSNTDRDQRRGGKSNGELAYLMHGADKEDGETRGSAKPRQEEARRLWGCQRALRPGGQPDRYRNNHRATRPSVPSDVGPK